MVGGTRALHSWRRRAPILLALMVAIAFVLAVLPAAADAALPRWRGGIDLYRPGVFTTQKTWYWCTAADVQIMRNIVHDKTNHTKAQQRRFFDYMRAHDRYPIPVRDGVDPAGWAAGLKLTRKQLKGFFTPWHYAPIRMAWEERWVSIQPRP